MTNRKNTKRALFASVISMLLCVTMLVGSTFAWFTDTVSTSLNTITAGNLNLQLLDADGDSLEGQTLTLAGTNVSEFIEPNGTYEFEPVTIKNAGNVNLKYKVAVTGIDGNAELLEVLTWEFLVNGQTGTDFDSYEGTLVPGQTHELKIRFTMDKDAGNEYMTKTISGIAINVSATQATGDNDSFTDDYDALAEYLSVDDWDGTKDDTGLEEGTDTTAKTVSITSAEQLAALVSEINNRSTDYRGYTIRLDMDLDLKGLAWTPINAWDGVLDGTTIDGNGHTIQNMTVSGGTSAGFISNNASSITIKDLTFDGAVVTPQSGNDTYSAVVMGKNYSKITLENIHVTNSQVISNWQCGGLVGFAEGNGPTFVNCSISDSFVGGYNCTAGAFFGLGAVDVTITGGSATNVDLYTDMEPGLVGYLYGRTLATNGCTVTDVVIVSEYPAN